MPLVVLEGIDGCGKTTQVEGLVARLADRGIAARVLREPGGTALGERVRELLLDPATVASPVAELFGYQMARAQIVEERLRPALAAGEWIVLDRFWYSTVAYQAYGLGLDVDAVRAAIALAVGDLAVDVACYCRIDVATAVARRAAARGEDRIERRGEAYLERVVAGYESLVAEGVLSAVDATATVAEVAEAIWAQVADLVPA